MLFLLIGQLPLFVLDLLHSFLVFLAVVVSNPLLVEVLDGVHVLFVQDVAMKLLKLLRVVQFVHDVLLMAFFDLVFVRLIPSLLPLLHLFTLLSFTLSNIR